MLLGQDRALGRSVWLWLRPATEPPLSAVRRDISRPSRLRWLACGRHEQWQWDAFMALGGGPLVSSCSPGGERWPVVKPILEQLTEELTTAQTEKSVPETLPVSQVWISPEGQVQLVDIPLGAEDDVGRNTAESPRMLSLLRQTVAQTLEGRPRPPGVAGPVQAPLPLPVRQVLNRLLGAGEPYRQVAAFQADLQALADRPAEISRGRRAVHLTVQALLLSFVVCWGMLPVGLVTQLLPTIFLTSTIRQREEGVRALEQGAALEAAVASVNPSLLVRLHGAIQFAEDSRLRDELEIPLARDRRRYQARVEAAGTVRQMIYHNVEKEEAAQWKAREKQRIRQQPELYRFEQFRRRATTMTVEPGLYEAMEKIGTFLGIFTLGPILWIVWAFLTRGGLSYRLLGIALVRRDGRLAARWQCAWRALLVWAPLTALLAFSLWLEARYWILWETSDPPRGWLQLSSASWYAALTLLLVYVILALWRPTRTLHDRLAGTYLVPR